MCKATDILLSTDIQLSDLLSHFNIKYKSIGKL